MMYYLIDNIIDILITLACSIYICKTIHNKWTKVRDSRLYYLCDIEDKDVNEGINVYVNIFDFKSGEILPRMILEENDGAYTFMRLNKQYIGKVCLKEYKRLNLREYVAFRRKW